MVMPPRGAPPRGASAAMLLFALALCFSDQVQASKLHNISVAVLDAEARGPQTRATAPVLVPDNYDSNKDWPLLIYLHPFCLSELGNKVQPAYYDTFVDSKQYVYVAPPASGRTRIVPYVIGTNMVQSRKRNERFLGKQGVKWTTTGEVGCQAWNANNACCDPANGGQSDRDVIYIRNIINEVKRTFSIDSDRIYLAGIANGGFMSFRAACELSNEIAAISTYAGATWNEISECSPESPVKVLAMHGTRDDVIFYGGGEGDNRSVYPSALGTTRRWARYNGCSTSDISEGPGPKIPKYMIRETTFKSGCNANGEVTLWKIKRAPHVLTSRNKAAPVLFGLSADFLLSASKPSQAASRTTANVSRQPRSAP